MACAAADAFRFAGRGGGGDRCEPRRSEDNRRRAAFHQQPLQTELPDQLQQALRRGVPLNFTLSWQLSAPIIASYRFKLGQLIGDDDNIDYKLSFHPLTNRYRVTVGAFSTDYDTLDAALRATGAVANWKVLNKGALSGAEAGETKAEIRLTLSTSKLPKPFQINALTSQNWHLDSGWKPLNIIGNK